MNEGTHHESKETKKKYLGIKKCITEEKMRKFEGNNFVIFPQNQNTPQQTLISFHGNKHKCINKHIKIIHGLF